MARCFVTRALPGGALDRLREAHEVEVWDQRLPPPYEELRRRTAGAEGLLSLLTDRVDAELIEGAPQLRAISNYAVGYDNVDVAAAAARGIQVGNTPDVLTEATADLAFALLLAAARRLPEAVASVSAGDWLTWEPGRYLGFDVHGATLGILGMGRIGRAVARRAEGFAMTVLHTGGEGSVDLNELLERSDFVSLHCPLTPDTHHLIDADALARMRPTAILINTARGPIVDQTALVDALHHETIAGAALDVTDPEPPAADDPLLSAPNLIIVPHIGSATHAARERMADLAVDNLLTALAGEPMSHAVDPDPQATPEREMNVAVVDIGSNSTRLLIADLEGDHLDELVRRTNVTRLGAGVDSDGKLREDAMQRVFDTLDGYRREIDEHDCQSAVAVLTSAVRDSSNGKQFADQVRDRYRLEPHVLTGDEEAHLTYLGATSERDADDPTPTLVLDIGGGSTELVIGAGHEVDFHVSTQAGVVRQTERHLHDDPPTDAQLQELAEDVRAILRQAVPDSRREGVRRGIGVAGTATSLAAIAQRLDPYDPERVHGYMLDVGECDLILGELKRMTVAQRREVPGLHPDRAPTIVAGVVIFSQVMALFGLNQIEISEHDILRGAALGLTGK